MRAARIYILNDLSSLASPPAAESAPRCCAARVDAARKAGAVRLKLSTAITNATAQRLYEAHGWNRDEEFSSTACRLARQREHIQRVAAILRRDVSSATPRGRGRRSALAVDHRDVLLAATA